MKHFIMQVIQFYTVTLTSWASFQLVQSLIKAIILQK